MEWEGEYVPSPSVFVWSQFAEHLGIARCSCVVLLEQTGKQSVSETKMHVASVLKVTAEWKEDQRNWTRLLTWVQLWTKSPNKRGRMTFIPEMLAGRHLLLQWWQTDPLQYEITFSALLSATCVILLITAHCITVKGEQHSTTCPHLAAWPQLTDRVLCCRPSFTRSCPSWRSL